MGDPEGSPWAQDLLNGPRHSTYNRNSGVSITAFMLQVARGEELPLRRQVAEADIQALRGRLAGMLVFCTLDPPEYLIEFMEGLGHPLTTGKRRCPNPTGTPPTTSSPEARDPEQHRLHPNEQAGV